MKKRHISLQVGILINELCKWLPFGVNNYLFIFIDIYMIHSETHSFLTLFRRPITPTTHMAITTTAHNPDGP